MIDKLPSCLQLHSYSFLGYKDAAHLMQCNRELYVYMQELRYKLPHVSFSSSQNSSNEPLRTPRDVIKGGLNQLRARPNMALIYRRTRSAKLQGYEDLLPPDMTVVAVTAKDIQVNNTLGTDISCDEDVSVILGAFPEAKCCPFYVDFENDKRSSLVDILRDQLEACAPNEEDGFWKVFIIHIVSQYHMISLTELQTAYPQSTIIGGVCAGGATTCTRNFETMKVDELKRWLRAQGVTVPVDVEDQVELAELAKTHCSTHCVVEPVVDGVFGIALGGNVPLKCCVTRGVKKAVESDCVVTKCVSLKPGEDGYPTEWFSAESELPVIQKISQVEVQDTESGTTEQFDIDEWRMHCYDSGAGDFQYIGICKKGGHGFMLDDILNSTFRDNCMWIETSDDLAEARINLFTLYRPAMMDDLNAMLSRLKTEVAEKEEELMGSIMVICNGRGPNRATDIEEMRMMDAAVLRQHFPGLHGTGFYANGEIGPKPLAEVDHGSFQFGHVALQSFTAVFGFFVQPLANLQNLLTVEQRDYSYLWKLCRGGKALRKEYNWALGRS